MNDLLSLATNAYQIINRLREINKNISNAEFANALADLGMELAEIKIKTAALILENEELRKKLKEKDSPSLTFTGFAYFSHDGAGPFCPKCYDSENKAVRLTRGPYALGEYTYKVCRNFF